jgi:hypothetical protein
VETSLIVNHAAFFLAAHPKQLLTDRQVEIPCTTPAGMPFIFSKIRAVDSEKRCHSLVTTRSSNVRMLF